MNREEAKEKYRRVFGGQFRQNPLGGGLEAHLTAREQERMMNSYIEEVSRAFRRARKQLYVLNMAFSFATLFVGVLVGRLVAKPWIVLIGYAVVLVATYFVKVRKLNDGIRVDS